MLTKLLIVVTTLVPNYRLLNYILCYKAALIVNYMLLGYMLQSSIDIDDNVGA